jgi:hypothetical protein
VCPGIYTEQLSSNKSLSIEGDDDAMFLPGNMVANTTGSTGTPIVVPSSSVATNQLGIHAGGQRDEIESNGISKSLGLVGIDLAGDNGLASRNDVTNSGQPAIYWCYSKGFIPMNCTRLDLNRAAFSLNRRSGTKFSHSNAYR